MARSIPPMPTPVRNTLSHHFSTLAGRRPQIVNSKWFDNTAVILFLNKRDLFEEKLKRVQVADYFEDFGDRDNEFEPAADFFRQKFLAKCKNQSKTIFTHYTVATDKKHVDLDPQHRPVI